MTNYIEEAIATFRANHEINDASDERATTFTVAGVEEEIRQAIESLLTLVRESIPEEMGYENEKYSNDRERDMAKQGQMYFNSCLEQFKKNLSDKLGIQV